jgi:hypothetical protein
VARLALDMSVSLSVNVNVGFDSTQELDPMHPPAEDHLVVHAIPLSMPRAPSLIESLRHDPFHQPPELWGAVQPHLDAIPKLLYQREEQMGRGRGLVRRRREPSPSVIVQDKRGSEVGVGLERCP